jgi:putative hydrolase of HD superfamily
MDRLAQQLEFLLVAERLTGVERRNVVFDLSRQENAAEHSWHMALMAAVLQEHFPEEIDLSRALEMALAHDLIEIHAGDTFAYGTTTKDDKDARERHAADLIYRALPDDQAKRLRALWDDFEASSSPEARFVRVLDRLQPLLLHRLTGGAAWKRHTVKKSQVLERVAEIERHAPALWPWVKGLLDEATRAGQLQDA